MKMRKLFAGIAAAATLLGGMTLATSAYADDDVDQVETCDISANTLTLNTHDAYSMWTWQEEKDGNIVDLASPGHRSFSTVKVADYYANGSEITLVTAASLKNDIAQAVANASKNAYNPAADGDPLTWLANNGDESMWRIFADAPGIEAGTEAHYYVYEEHNDYTSMSPQATATFTMDDENEGAGLYMIFDITNPKQQKLVSGNATTTYNGFKNMLVGTAITGCQIGNATGSIPEGTVDAKTDTSFQTKGHIRFRKVGVDNDKNGLEAYFLLWNADKTKILVKDVADKDDNYIVDFDMMKLDAGTYYVQEISKSTYDGVTVDDENDTFADYKPGVPDGYWAASAALLKFVLVAEAPSYITTVQSVTVLDPVKTTKEADVEANSAFQGLWTDSNSTYKNIKKVTDLPLTGAAGTALFTIVGLLLAGAAAMLLVKSRFTKRQLAA